MPTPIPQVTPPDRYRRPVPVLRICLASSSAAFGLWLRIWPVQSAPSGGGVQCVYGGEVRWQVRRLGERRASRQSDRHERRRPALIAGTAPAVAPLLQAPLGRVDSAPAVPRS